MPIKYYSYFIALVLIGGATNVMGAPRVQLSNELPKLDIIYNNTVVTIAREQNSEHILDGTFAITSRPCPPSCIRPIEPVKGINIVAELEIFQFLEREYLNESGLVIDARSADWFKRGTIPGSINFSANQLDNNNIATNPESLLDLVDANERYDVGRFTRFLEKSGIIDADRKTDSHDFTHAKKLLIWDNGPWSDSSEKVIAAFVSIGYPVDYIYYYHGGMQSWQTLGLTVVKP